MLKILLGTIGGIIALALLIQLVPYGRNHTNPAVVAEPKWDSPQTRDLAVRACFDCHSNETVWPWYSNVAPLSWLIQRDVDEGRRKLNFSDWTRPPRENESAEQVERGKMPQWYYIMLHPNAGLSSPEKQVLIQGLRKSLSLR